MGMWLVFLSYYVILFLINFLIIDKRIKFVMSKRDLIWFISMELFGK